MGILLNNIMLCLSDYMIRYTAIAELNKSVAMSIQIVPTFSRMSLLVASVVIMVAYTLIMRNTVPGYRLRMVGSNPDVLQIQRPARHPHRADRLVHRRRILRPCRGRRNDGHLSPHALGLRRWHGLFRHDGGADRQGEPAGHGARLAASGRAAKRSVNLTVSTSVQAEIVNVIKGFVMLFATVNLLQYFRGAKKEAAK